MAIPVSNSVSLTGNPDIDFLIQGSSWSLPSNNVLTYSLHNIVENSAWFPQEIEAVRNAFDAWEAVANIKFERVGGAPNGVPENTSADIAISFTGFTLSVIADPRTLGLGVFPDPIFVDNSFLPFLASPDVFNTSFTRVDYPKPEGDIFIDDFNNTLWFDTLDPGGQGRWTITHEIGHALGLSHPDDDGNNLDQSLTVMSYNAASTVFGVAELPQFGHATTPMPMDILAIQHIYGPNMSYNTGNNTYEILDDGVYQTVWDAGGTDTFDASALREGLGAYIDLNEGGYSASAWSFPYSLTAIAYNVTIENAIGSQYDDTITGNAVNNRLIGLGGDDTLLGKLGNDILFGSGGNDTLRGDLGNDRLYGGTGDDKLYSGRGTDILIAQNGDDSLYSASSSDRLYGGNGNDLLNGNGGHDLLIGQNGNDRLYGGSGNDRLYGGAGLDLLVGSGGHDYLVGQDDNDRLYGGPGNDRIYGSAGADLMIGQGDHDRMYGGTENDRMYGDAGLDLLVAGTGNDSLYGGTDADRLYGQDGDDSLTGGSGNDRLYGGDGNDLFIFTDNEGVDTIYDFTVGAASDDIIELISVAGITTFTDAQAAASQSGLDTIIDLGGGDQITLIGINVGDLHEDDFLFT